MSRRPSKIRVDVCEDSPVGLVRQEVRPPKIISEGEVGTSTVRLSGLGTPENLETEPLVATGLESSENKRERGFYNSRASIGRGGNAIPVLQDRLIIIFRPWLQMANVSLRDST